ncbi:WD40 repeat-containing protein, putative [Bodo saltans]|uniref:WD40 repeat-containing protein, putative n=1 Tax=Bodo saltans TaxID=75058 RepID=A0A0S4JA64_BODSA|nr:WD40 repeat-containing protein, putative [Bodo saltans]|eukprot:CUG88447.1 WD40 repeat-containing protein, putative [Bodo saltans]
MAATMDETMTEDFNYEEVTVDGDEGILHDDPTVLGDEDENFEMLLRSVQAQQDREAPPPVRADLTRLPEVVDDFIRNFFVKHNMPLSLETFELEWYERFGANPDEDAQAVPEVYLENTRLHDQVKALAEELQKHKDISNKSLAMWESVKKERDFHRMSHNRVMQEKGKLSRDLKRLQTHAQAIEPTLTELRQKYEGGQKDKMLLRMERDKLQARISALEEQLREAEGKDGNAAAGGAKPVPTKPQKPGAAATNVVKAGVKGAASSTAALEATLGPVTRWPADERPNPNLNQVIRAPSNIAAWNCRANFKAHTMTVTRAAIHPKKQVVATSSDDGTWRLMSLPHGELIMSGEGHKDWVAGIAMHPKGTMVATASGDKTVKLWDFATNSCKSTLKAHTEGVWCVEFQETGDLLASGSVDKTARVWDVELAKCKQSLRGHVDSVNSITWQPYTNILCTGSGDKTVSLWDVRANFCVQTFYGHHSAVTGVSMYHKGDTIASCDGEGNVIVWDVRMIEQRHAFACGPHPANSVSFDRSGTLLAVASDDTTIKVISLLDEKISVLRGHEDAVQCAVFDPATNGFLVSCGTDATVRYWS